MDKKLNFIKLKPCLEPWIGCACCSCCEMKYNKNQTIIYCSLDVKIYNGFGGWKIMKDGIRFFEADPSKEITWNKIKTLKHFEKLAAKDPKHDWRAVVNLPLRDATYQRQGKEKWVLVKSGKGFA